jgi:hypothetical protein
MERSEIRDSVCVLPRIALRSIRATGYRPKGTATVRTSVLRQYLIGFCIIFAFIGAVYVATIAGFLHGMKRADPYPPFMADYQLKKPGTYAEDDRAFNKFVGDTFPIGSNAKQAVALITSQGFDIVSSTTVSFSLLWARQAGPCSEHYLIMIRQSEDSSIVDATGRLNPACL